MTATRLPRDRQLTGNFWLSELIGSEVAVRLGIDNAPGPRELQAVEQILAPGLQRVRELLGCAVLVSSGFRCAALNRAINGAVHSAHMEGLAADFTAPGYGGPLQVARAIAAEPGIDFAQLIHEGGAWVHLAFPPAGRQGRRELLTATFAAGRIRYRGGLA